MLILELIATFSIGVFFGAALYISLVQHPAALETGLDFARRFHAPMYRRAAMLQASLALIGTVSAALVYFLAIATIWLIASILILSVVPLTLVVIKPVNDVLMNNAPLGPDEVRRLFERWGWLHGLRTLASGAAFVACLYGLARLN